MTREEAIKVFESELKWAELNRYPYISKQEIEADKMAIKALEQEPCEDCISRQSAISLASDLKQDLPDDEHIADMVMAHNEGILGYQTQLSLLPPVTPQPKTGHWIADVDKWGDIVTTVNGYRCDKCNTFNSDKDNYCPNCGCRMIEPQERDNT